MAAVAAHDGSDSSPPAAFSPPGLIHCLAVPAAPQPILAATELLCRRRVTTRDIASFSFAFAANVT